ncbi:MAG TPA: hypothetical protein VHV75_12465 [Solirubrobacteraceae bacterium]|jgi:hypothetical protein|nr:hypothetical protein [Solirubrobacteraceae bacterium]
MQLKTNVRNVIVIAVLAAVVYALGNTGDFALSFLVQLISLAFLASLGWIASRQYHEHRNDLYGLGTRRRTILYVALGVATLAISAFNRLTSSGFGTVVWLVLLGGAGYAIYAVYRSTREY